MSTHEPTDELSEDEDLVLLTVFVPPKNIEALVNSAKLHGDTETETVSRSFTFYERVTGAKVGTVISWEDGAKNPHAVLVIK